MGGEVPKLPEVEERTPASGAKTSEFNISLTSHPALSFLICETGIVISATAGLWEGVSETAWVSRLAGAASHQP